MNLPHHLFVRRSMTLAPLLLALAVALAACSGSRGYAPPLGKTGHATLGAQASATLAPFYAMRVAVYYHGQQLSVTDPLVPAQVREDQCGGPFVAPLTANAINPADVKATDVTQPVITAPDAQGGMDVALTSSDRWYVVILDRAAGPDAIVTACGAPISDRRQYFDLTKPNELNRGVALGTALIDPFIATRVTLTLPASATASGQATWALHDGGRCDGAIVAQGTAAQGVTSASGVAFVAPDTSGNWRLAFTPAGDAQVCAKVS